jgi:peptide deformylase
MEIVLYPDPRLTAKNAELASFDREAERRVMEMLKLNAALDGAGIAAPQSGWNVRLFVLTVPAAAEGDGRTRIVWNPSVETSGEIVLMREGCLSFPGVSAQIPRFSRARLVGQTPEGPIDEVFVGFGAQAVQHEMDHLDGTLFITKMSEADRLLNKPILEALEARAKRVGIRP